MLDTADQRIAELRELVDAVQEGLPIERQFLDQANLEELPNSELLQRLAPILDELSAAAANAVSTLEQAQAIAVAASAEVRKDWEQKSEEAHETYQQTLRELQREKIDGEEFIRLRRRIEQLEPLKQQRDQLHTGIATLRDRRRSAVISFEEAKAKEFRALERGAKNVTRRLNARVRVTVTYQGDREPLAELPRREVGVANRGVFSSNCRPGARPNGRKGRARADDGGQERSR